jgi:hypothetical protein
MRPPFCQASTRVTAGLKCAPDMGPSARIKATIAAPVETVFARSAMATLPPASRSPMIPEPTTAASRNAVPTASVTERLAKSTCIACAASYVAYQGAARNLIVTDCLAAWSLVSVAVTVYRSPSTPVALGAYMTSA